jgi:hypothetical protein
MLGRLAAAANYLNAGLASSLRDLNTKSIYDGNTVPLQSLKLSFTAIAMFCSDPRYRSVVWMEEWPTGI